MSFNQIQENIEQMNNFVRGAKKKSSLKTGKSTYKELHSGLRNMEKGKMKSIKWEQDDIDKLKSHITLPINRKKLDEVKAHYIAYVNRILLIKPT